MLNDKNHKSEALMEILSNNPKIDPIFFCTTMNELNLPDWALNSSVGGSDTSERDPSTFCHTASTAPYKSGSSHQNTILVAAGHDESIGFYLWLTSKTKNLVEDPKKLAETIDAINSIYTHNLQLDLTFAELASDGFQERYVRQLQKFDCGDFQIEAMDAETFKKYRDQKKKREPSKVDSRALNESQSGFSGA